MTEEEWLAFREHLRELERRYTKEVLYRYGGDGPRAVLYFMDNNGMECGDVMKYTKDHVTLRVKNNRGSETLAEDRDFSYHQLYTQEYYEKHMKELQAEGKTYLLVCKVCGKTFGSKTKDRATCGQRCTRALKQRGGKTQGVKGTGITVSAPMTEEERKRTCPICGMAFRAKRRNQRCCSEACSEKLWNQTRKLKKEAMKLKDSLKGCKL